MRALILAAMTALAACGAPADDADDNEAKAKQGRAETQNIRGTDAIGYSGGAIADKVDASLDANDERNRKMQEASAAPE